MSAQRAEARIGNRWTIAAAGIVMQLALGAVYAWSVFRNPLMDEFGWTISQVTLTFTITIFVLGASAFFGGLLMNRIGPRKVGMLAGALYGAGVLLASLSADNLAVLYATYGVLAGIGIGFGYIVPVATLVKWFPDKRGFITGIAVAGFGAGALLTAPIATRLIDAVGVLQTFAILGVAYFAMVSGAATLMRNPPEGFRPEGWEPTESQKSQRAQHDFALGEALKTPQWYALWLLLFLNVSAGIAIISQAAPMAEEITGASAFAAAGLVGIISVGNGAGRFLWAWLSDLIGRRQVFLVMYLLQAAAFVAMALVDQYVAFAAIAFVVLSAYGGGFGTMPAFAADYFGPKNVGSVYGLMLTAWGFGGILGPVLIASIREATGAYTNALYVIAGIMLVSAIVPLIVRPPRTEQEAHRRAGVRRQPRPAS